MERQKWWNKTRNVRVNDIVLLVGEGEARCHWPLGRIVDSVISDDGLVRKVKIRVGEKVFLRPVSKIIIILENEDLA